MLKKITILIFATLTIANCANTAGNKNNSREVANTKPVNGPCKILSSSGEILKQLQYGENVNVYRSAEVPEDSVCVAKILTCGRDFGPELRQNGSFGPPAYLTCEVVQESGPDQAPTVSP